MLKWFAGLVVALAATAAVFWIALPHWPVRTAPEGITLTVAQGASLSRIAADAARQGLAPAWVIRAVARMRSSSTRMMPGEYRFAGPLSVAALLAAIEEGKGLQRTVTLIEGAQLRELVTLLRQASEPPIGLVLEGLDDPEALNRFVGGTHASAEGWFFPDTYAVAPRSSARALLQSMHQAMKRELALAWAERTADLPLTDPYQALILASIIEKETGRDAERPLIASVFVNRLRLGMRLQTDPTVIYGLGDSFDGNLRRRDLVADTPYNTYTRAGLPPTPIAMPGRASLRAAVAPATTDYLYFVARGDGSSEFSRSLAEHNRAVARYQLKQ